MKPVALVDMDGTIADLMGALDAELRNLQAPCEQPMSDNIFDYMHDDVIQRRMKLVKRQEGFWRNLPVLEKGMEIVQALYAIGYEIHVLTKGPRYAPIAWREKIEWCDRVFEEYGIPHQTTITENKGLVYGRVLVDDYPEYILAWLEYRPRGFVVMPASRWNETFVHPQVVRYQGGDLGEYEMIEEKLREVKNRGGL